MSDKSGKINLKGDTMYKVYFTQTGEDELNHMFGEKKFEEEALKEDIDNFIKNAMKVFRDTMPGRINCIICQGRNDSWTIPVNPKTLKNEL